MSVKVVLFDLDGTLLPMDQEDFIKAYFGGLAKMLAGIGYDPEKLVNAIWACTGAMIKNNGEGTNEETFWRNFEGFFGEKVREDEPYFEEFYHTDFQKVADVCGFAPQAAEVIGALQKAGIRRALATNPLFPAIATHSRIRWAGMQPEDFELVTTYENSSYCKPNLKYYEEVLAKIGVAPEECLMVGNDVGEDMITERLGMKVFLLTDCLINKDNVDISKYPNGSFGELMLYLKEMALI
jgi:FMN phosphatase YigB (HAD superfamily)